MKANEIIVHVSAHKEGEYVTANDIIKMHRKRGFRTIGYHCFIRTDGAIEQGRPFNEQGAHVKGHNKRSIGICLAGGLDKDGNAKDTRTDEQKHALFAELIDICQTFNIPFSNVCGHRDKFPDKNGDGKIDRQDWLKDCPCFDVRKWFKNELIMHGYIEG